MPSIGESKAYHPLGMGRLVGTARHHPGTTVAVALVSIGVALLVVREVRYPPMPAALAVLIVIAASISGVLVFLVFRPISVAGKYAKFWDFSENAITRFPVIAAFSAMAAMAIAFALVYMLGYSIRSSP